MQVKKELLEKYNKPVPRYTSYPPANHFTTNFGPKEFVRLLNEATTQQPEHMAFYFHIPFCHKICFYCGCNAYPLGNEDRVVRYLNAMKKEFQMLLPYLDKSRKVSQIHFGGGTPNAIDANYLGELVDMIRKEFAFIEKPEIAIECNPAHLDKAYVDELLQAGFNRFSLGIQDFNEETLRKVNRDSTNMPIEDIIAQVKSFSPAISVNFDFIYGLPNQTEENFTETIQKAIDYHPDRLVTFSYAHVPWLKRHQQILEKMGLPSAEKKMNLFLRGYERLLESGYKAIGFDHYVLPEDELYKALEDKLLHRNFQGYCTRRTTGQVYALGVSSISQLYGGYAQNNKNLIDYVEVIESGKLATEKGVFIKPEQQIRKAVITELMCNKMIHWESLSQQLNKSTDEIKKLIHYNPENLQDYAKDQILSFTDNEIVMTEMGSLFIRNVAAELDSEFHNQAFTYSKSV